MAALSAASCNLPLPGDLSFTLMPPDKIVKDFLAKPAPHHILDIPDIPRMVGFVGDWPQLSGA